MSGSHEAVLHVGDPVPFRGRSWVLADHDGITRVTLRDPSNGELLITSTDELVEEDTAPEALARIMDAFTGVRQPKWLPHVMEVVDGTPIDGGNPRPQYANSVPLMDRYASKSAELTAAGWSHASEGTVRRMVTRYRAGGAVALVDGRSQRTYDMWDGLHPLVRVLCEEVNQGLQGRSTTTLRHRAAMVRKRFRDAYPDQQELWPTQRKLCRLLQSLERGVGLSGSAKTRRTEAAAAKGPYRERAASIPGALVEIDSTSAEVLVRCADGRARRPTLMVMVDVATRVVMAINVTMRPDGPEIAEMIADACTIPTARPVAGASWFARHLERLPEAWANVAQARKREAIDQARPRIRIRDLTTDHGADYKAKCLARTCEAIGASVVRAAPRSPDHKPHAERVMDTIRVGFMQAFPGYVGNGPDWRGDHPDREELFDLDVFAFALDYLIANVYNNREHSELRDPRFPADTVRLSPNAAYEMHRQYSASVPKPISSDIYLLAQRDLPRKIDRRGVHLGNRDWNSEELLEFYNSSDFDSSLKYPVHYRPRDPSRVWVYVPPRKAFITCWPTKDHRDLPNSDVWNAKLQALEARPPLTHEQAADATVDIVDAIAGATRPSGPHRELSHIEDDRRVRAALGKVDFGALRPAKDADHAVIEGAGFDEHGPMVPPRAEGAEEPEIVITPAPPAYRSGGGP